MAKLKHPDRDEVQQKTKGNGSESEMGPLRKWFWRILAALSLFWIFFPEWSDLFFPLGWLDEGFALFLFLKALSKLGITIPLLENLLSLFAGRKKR